MKFAPLLILALSMSANAADWVVEFARVPTKSEITKLNKTVTIERFDDFDSDFFKRAYLVSSNLDAKELEKSLSRTIQVNGIETISKVEAFSVQPAAQTERYRSDDQLLPYQWGLVSQGQKVRRDKDDINYVLLEDSSQADNTPDWMLLLGDRVNDLPADVLANLLAQQQQTSTSSASDINYVGYLEATKSLEPAKEVKVAVLDSGIDLGHPELKNVIAKNLVECNEEGNTNYETREDHDDNGVPGDCLGWNFTVHKNDPRAKLPMDDAGHGTHVAGIIAAEGSNKTGVRGMGANIKIVPVKVLNEDESTEESRQIALTDRIARGILYSIKREVDVINLSLGWLRQSDTKYLREAVNAALARGISVVSAAGNNGSNARLYPCAYPGVVCVGASTINSKKADFSNQGGSVDVFAPGDSILSTWPISLVPLDFSVHGYEIQSGTSQATPFVSGAIAQLKANLPNLGIAEIQARLMLGANSDILKDDESLGLAGRLDMAKSLTVSPQPAVTPVFKSLDEISYTLKDKKFRVPLPIVNYWIDSDEVKVTLDIDNQGIKLNRTEFNIPGIKREKSVTLPIDGIISDVNADRTATIVVTVETSGKTKVYKHVVNFVRLLIDDPEVEEMLVSFSDKPKPLALVQDDKVQPLVTTIESHYGTESPEWFLRKNTETGIELTFFSIAQKSVVEGATLSLAGAKRILGLTNIDFDRDGSDDRLIQTTAVNAEGEENAIIYSFRKKDGTNVFGNKSDWRFVPDVAVPNETLAFTNAQIEGTGIVPAPIFVEEGPLPEHQQPTGFFDQRDEAVRKRVYLLEPTLAEDGSINLTTYALDTKNNMDQWKESLGLRWSDPLRISTILAPTLEEHQKGLVRVLISGGHASRRKDAILTISSRKDFKFEEVDLAGIRPEDQDAVRVTLIESDRFARHEKTGFIGFYDGKRARASVVGESLATQPYVLKDEFDHYSGHVASFISGNALTSVYTTSNRLVMVQDSEQTKKVLERPLERFDFLPGQVFNELFWPVARENSNGDLFPSLYVDASGIHTNSVHVIEARTEGFIAPMSQSVLLPPNCKALNPIILPGEKAHRTTMICLEKDRGYVFKFVK